MRYVEMAVAEEQNYLNDRMKNINTSLIERIRKYGYETLDEYFKDKKEYLFTNWKPEVHYIEVSKLTTDLERAILNREYGVYISQHDGLYAFHGSDSIDYDLCKELNIEVAELFYNGGTIIGSNKDLGIWICAPTELNFNTEEIIQKFFDIISKYIPNVEIAGNDILADGKKIMGSMFRRIGHVFVWAAQVSFGEYDEIIEKICNKKSSKNPGHIDEKLLNRNTLEKEILKWLQKL